MYFSSKQHPNPRVRKGLTDIQTLPIRLINQETKNEIGNCACSAYYGKTYQDFSRPELPKAHSDRIYAR